MIILRRKTNRIIEGKSLSIIGTSVLGLREIILKNKNNFAS